MRAARRAPPAPAAAPTTLRLQAQPRRPAPPRTCISRPAGARVDAAPSRATLPFAAPATSRAQQHHCSAQSRMCTGHSVRTLRCCAPQSGSRGSLPGLPWHWSTLFSHALKGWRPGVDWRVEDHVARATAEVTRLLAAGANPDGYKEVRAPRCRLPPCPFRALPSCAALTTRTTPPPPHVAAWLDCGRQPRWVQGGACASLPAAPTPLPRPSQLRSTHRRFHLPPRRRPCPLRRRGHCRRPRPPQHPPNRPPAPTPAM